MAERQPQRIVHAVEPLPSNVARMEARWKGRLPNLRTLHGGLGSAGRLVFDQRAASNGSAAGVGAQVEGVDSMRRVDEAQANAPGVFRVHRIDDLFSASGLWHGERLGFAHFDVEGGELDVLRGGLETIQRDRPVFTVETFVHNHANLTRQLLRVIRNLDYRSFLIEEQCGLPVDCRNIINFPKELLPSFKRSPTLDLASSTGRLVAISEGSASSHAYAAACVPGAVCCANGPAGTGFVRGWWRTDCCASACVRRWLGTLVGAQASAPHASQPWGDRGAIRRSLF